MLQSSLSNSSYGGVDRGACDVCLAAWVTRPCYFCPLRHFSRLRFLPACGRTLHPLRSLRDLRHFIWLLRYVSPALAGFTCQRASSLLDVIYDTLNRTVFQ